MTGVAGNVGCCGNVTSGTGGGAGRSLIGGTGGERGSARLAHRYLITHPGAPCFDSFPRPVVFRVLLLEVWEYMLSAVSGPEHQ